MPIYEYECQGCGHHVDKLQKLSDSVLITCPKCGKDQLKKLVSPAGFQLKGTGWYVTDFKNKDKSTTPKSGESDGGAGDSTGEVKASVEPSKEKEKAKPAVEKTSQSTEASISHKEDK